MITRLLFARVVPVLVFLAPCAPGQLPSGSQSASASSQTPIGSTVAGRFLVSYRGGSLPTGLNARTASAGGRLLVTHQTLGISVVQAAPGSEGATLAALLADPSVSSVVRDRIVSAHAIAVRAAVLPAAGAADSLYNSAQGWAVQAVGGFGDSKTAGPWTTTTGAGVKIAILDSGVDATHPDIAPNLALNLSLIDQTPATGLPSPCDDGSATDQQGHGTWTASLAAGAYGAQTGMVAGVAPSATLLNIKVLERMPSATTSAADPTGCNAGEASGLLSWVLAGIQQAVTLRADVISLSLGTLVDITTGDGAGLQTLFNQATQAAANAGVLIVASAGNDGFDLSNQRYVELPAMARGVLAVTASTNPACAENLATGAICAPGAVTRPYYSDFGAPLNALAAPGGSYPAGPDSDTTQASGWIWGACSNGIASTISGPPADSAHSFGCFGLGHTSYVQAMGTSASAPLVAGAAALLRAANPSWGPSAVIAALRSAAIPLPQMVEPAVSVAALLTPLSTTSRQNQHLTAGLQH